MNSKIKGYYVESNYTNINTIKLMYHVFGRASQYEQEKQKDLAQLSYDEVIEMYKSMKLSKIREIRRCNNQYKRYVDFCIARKIFPDVKENVYKLFSKEDLNEMLSGGFLELTDEKYHMYLSQMVNPVNKFLIQASYEGLSFEEMMLAKYSDINKYLFTCHKINDDGIVVESRKLMISDAFKQYAYESSNTYVNCHMKDGKKIVDRGQYGEFIAKDGVPVIEGDMSKERLVSRKEMIRKRFIGISRNTDGNMTYTKIRYFAIYSIIEQEALRRNISPDEALTQELVEKLNERFDQSLQYSAYQEMIEEHR